MTDSPPFQIAPPHPREAERIRALHDLNVLDTPPSPRFDRITSFATGLFGVPTALVSLVDENRQWFLSRCGLDVSETERDVAFCAHAILENNGLLIVEDALRDPRFANNPLVVSEPHLRFYAGAVLYDNRHMPLGTLCVIDYKPRAFSEDDKRNLLRLADLVRMDLLPVSEAMMERTQAQLNAQIDPLTNAQWQQGFADGVDGFLRESGGHGAKFVSVTLSNLTLLNDTFGRAVGDEILAQIADRMRQALVPIGRVQLGRVAGRTLAVFLTDCPSTTLEEIEHAVVQAVCAPVRTHAGELSPEIRVGLSDCAGDGHTSVASELVRCRLAIQNQSQNDRIVSGAFSAALEDHWARRVAISSDLAQAIEDGVFHLVYQPKVHAFDGTLRGFECLLRWRHPSLGDVPPNEIVAVAEELKLSECLDRWVIETAVKQMASWRRDRLAYGTVSVNINGCTLIAPEFAPWLAATLAEYGVPADDLDLEIVESSIFDSFDSIVPAMASIGESGVTFSLDDFGTGYSSLAYLRALPVSTLKIDRSFVRNIVTDKSDASLCSGIVQIARDLDLTVVAEGVETEQQLAILRGCRCDQIQGFYFSKPVSASAATQMLQSASTDIKIAPRTDPREADALVH